MSARANDSQIMPFAPADAVGVAALAQAEGWPTFSDPTRVLRLFGAPGALGVVAVEDPDTVIGAAHLLTDGHHGYLTFLAVATQARRRGIGSGLITALFEASGAQRIDLLSTPEAEPFYRNLPHRDVPGFRVYPT